MDTADDVRNDRFRRIEDAALDFLFAVVFRQKQFVEMDDRIFLRVAVVEIAKNSVQLSIRAVQKRGDFLNAEFVEVDLTFASAEV